MAKIKNRFARKGILTIHDNLLSDLYSLSLDSITSKEINNEEYLINESYGRGYQVGLMAKIPIDLLTIDGKVKKYDELLDSEQEAILDKLKYKLYFSNIEILITNMLLDKFLANRYDFDISFKEMEIYYRRKTSSRRNITLNDLTYKRYLKTINSLAEKTVYLKTNGTFRKAKYGVNNRNIIQPFITILNQYHYSKNNIVFSYSFNQFGNVLKLSRRYSSNLVCRCYWVNFNQSMKHSIAYFMGQQIFIASYRPDKHRYPIPKNCGYLELDINSILQNVHYENKAKNIYGYSVASKLEGYKSQPNKNRTYRMILGYIEELLSYFKANNSIYEYEIVYSYEETEAFSEKHEFDYDMDDNLNYEFTIKDINQDVSAIVKIYITEYDYDFVINAM